MGCAPGVGVEAGVGKIWGFPKIRVPFLGVPE